MLNKFQVMGYVGSEVKFTTKGEVKVAKFSIATNERWKDDDGTTKEKTEWHYITAFGKKAILVNEYVKKGSKVYVEAKLSTNKYIKDGVEKYSTAIILKNIIFLDKKKVDTTPDEVDITPEEDTRQEIGS